MVRADRNRLDELMVARGLAPSRSSARGLIMAGLVSVSGEVCDKAGTLLPADARILLKERPRFVSRAGEKLAGAIEHFAINVRGVAALDVGSSTGGFVDCLLQFGASKVIAVDVGRGQLDWRLRNEPRVVVLEGVNARYLSSDVLPYEPDFLTMDVSFISITKVLPTVIACFAREFAGLILIKPQFEAGPGQVGKGGVIRESETHRLVLMERGRFVINELPTDLLGICRAIPSGADGNTEFFFHIGPGGEKGVGLDRLESLVDQMIAGEG